MDVEKLMMTIEVSEYLQDVLGPLEKVPIRLKTARLLQVLQVPSIHIQFYELDGPNEGKPLERPIIWQWKYWHADLQRRKRFKEKADFERRVCNIQSDNIAKYTKYLVSKMHLPENLARFAAEKIVVNNDQSFAKALNIDIQQLNESEFAAAHEYNEMLKQRKEKR